MLPDYIDTKQKIQDALSRWLRKRVKKYLGPFGDVPNYFIFEGERTSIIRPDNQEDVTEMRSLEKEFNINRDEVPYLTLNKILEKLDRLAQDIADEMAKHSYRTISEATDRIGNVVKSQGQITPEALLEVLNKIEINFDEKGQPELPSIHIHPDLADTLKDALTALEVDPIYKQRVEEIMTEKRRRHSVREASRKLVG